jgi:hypothetical protein
VKPAPKTRSVWVDSTQLTNPDCTMIRRFSNHAWRRFSNDAWQTTANAACVIAFGPMDFNAGKASANDHVRTTCVSGRLSDMIWKTYVRGTHSFGSAWSLPARTLDSTSLPGANLERTALPSGSWQPRLRLLNGSRLV